ncbi:MAG: hypothetical protein VB071_13340 [Lawsonibacter sp.]|nr:hypothetical protein [Lawsonibacter sp.]
MITKPKNNTIKDAKSKEFCDMTAPDIIKFQTDLFICGNTFRGWRKRESSAIQLTRNGVPLI